MNKAWEDVYMELVVEGYNSHDMPTSFSVINAYLTSQGYSRYIIPNTCPSPNCYTIRHFCEDHKEGKYILITDNHMVAVMDGNYFDTWDSGDEVPMYYYTKEVR